MGVVQLHKFTVDGHDYSTTTFPASKAFLIGARLMRTLKNNPAWTALLAAADEPEPEPEPAQPAPEGESSLDPDTEADTIEGRAKGLFSKLVEHLPIMINGVISAVSEVTPEELLSLCKECLSQTSYEEPGKTPVALAIHFDSHFRERMWHLFKVWAQVVRIGFTGPSREGP